MQAGLGSRKASGRGEGGCHQRGRGEGAYFMYALTHLSIFFSSFPSRGGCPWRGCPPPLPRGAAGLTEWGPRRGAATAAGFVPISPQPLGGKAKLLCRQTGPRKRHGVGGGQRSRLPAPRLPAPRPRGQPRCSQTGSPCPGCAAGWKPPASCSGRAGSLRKPELEAK